MTLLNNAIEAIQIGLEDFKSTDPRRASSALRNIFAGTLLLFKEKLSRLSPDDNSILIQQTIIPSLDDAGVLFFKGKGHKTVDFAQINLTYKMFMISFYTFYAIDQHKTYFIKINFALNFVTIIFLLLV
ncbi:hypothetical protein ATE49_19410 [Elizabethkingia miricola]|uniref:Uncharacterized protein n=1 Tax=Elizabethkingia miricola TaxID=172045 RepID=A0ABY3NG78_ELIMR|nr:hypothetical protein [Elizabethkingia miricola]OBS14807.1 hypothetical protein ATE49_19410 [Elizabethkingia miricola]TYO92021.1 hypothetical protein LX74_01678 [Elizabethkingia miricola]